MFRCGLFRCLVLFFCLGSIGSSPTQMVNDLRKAKVEEILSYIDTNVDACANFYQYSCGHYGEHYQEFSSLFPNMNPLYHAGYVMKEQIINHLNTTKDTSKSDVDRKVKSFYKSCLNRPEAANASSEALKRLVREFGKMPVLEGNNWREEDFHWAKVVAEINGKTDIGIIMHTKITPDSFDNSMSRATIVQPELTLPTKAYYEDESLENYRLSVIQSIKLNLEKYLNVKEHLAQQTAEEIFNFELALSRGMQNLEMEKPDVLYNVTTIDEVQAEYLPVWNTIEHMAITLDLYPSRVTTQPTYLKNLVEVIQKTPKKVVANYIFYTYLKVYMNALDSECIDLMRTHFKEYIENAIYHKHTTEQDRAYVNFMYQEISSAFEDTFNSNKVNWVSEETRKLAIKKLKNMQFRISSYDHINFKQKYSSLSINEHNILDNMHQILLLQGKEGKARIIQPPKFMDPPNDMLVYGPENNVIHFPVAYVQPNPIWSTSYPFAYNFGGIGTFIAHEISHGFDDLGRNFDKNGNYHNWWDSISSENFEQRRDCFVNQYKNYTFRGINLPELKNQCENISDNVGIQHAFKAYMKWYNKASITNRQNEIMPGLKYNNKQLFFLGFAQTLGGVAFETFVYDNDDHLPNELRVKGTLDNYGEFAKAFNCAPGSAMNPIKKCELY